MTPTSAMTVMSARGTFATSVYRGAAGTLISLVRRCRANEMWAAIKWIGVSTNLTAGFPELIAARMTAIPARTSSAMQSPARAGRPPNAHSTRIANKSHQTSARWIDATAVAAFLPRCARPAVRPCLGLVETLRGPFAVRTTPRSARTVCIVRSITAWSRAVATEARCVRPA